MTPKTDIVVSNASGLSQKDFVSQVAKLAEYTERYDDMAKFMKQLVELADGTITSEERNLLSVAYKQVVSGLRSGYRTIKSIDQTGHSDSKKKVAAEYTEQIKKEMRDVCMEAIELLEKFLIEKAADSEAKVFFLKMKGDYCRYVAEVTDSDSEDFKAVVKRSQEAYQGAYDIAEKSMAATNPTRLGLALNFSVFHYEIANAHAEAIQLAKKSFDEAVAELDSLNEDAYKDSTVIMQLLRDNLTLWNFSSDAEKSDSDDQPTTAEEDIKEEEQSPAVEDASQTEEEPAPSKEEA